MIRPLPPEVQLAPVKARLCRSQFQDGVTPSSSSAFVRLCTLASLETADPT
jgi:hypothetical protein